VGPAVVRRPWHVGIGTFAVGLALAEADTRVAIGVAGAALVTLSAARAATLGAVAATLLLCGAVAGEVRLAAIDAPAERIRDGEHVELRAHLLTPPRPSPFGASAEVAVTSGRLRGARLLVRAARWAPLPGAVRVGEELRLEGRLKALTPPDAAGGGTAGAPDDRSEAGSAGAADDRSEAGSASAAEDASGAAAADAASFDFAAHLRRRGVAGELLLDERARRTGSRRGGLAGALDGMREQAQRAVVAGMSPADGALLRGMVLGQDEAIDTALRDDFRDSGLAHLLAVSGQNVMLLAALALPALMLAGLGLRARLAALVALIALYVPLAGAGPSLQRAGVMGIAGMVAMAASRPASRSYALLLAAALTLAWNPRSWADPGWQLSFAAVAGILALGVPMSRSLRRVADDLVPPPTSRARGTAALRLLADGVAITVSATVATAPLLAHHFGSVPLAGLLSNLLALPAVAPAMWLGMLKIALGQAGGPGHAAADALGAVATYPVAYIASLAERCADLSGGQLALPLGSPLALLTAYAALAAATVAAARLARPLAEHLPERSARWRRLPRTHRLALATAVCLALLAAAAPALDGPEPPGRLTVRFLDVGQGDSTLIQHPDGTAVLFDGGPPEAGVARLLRKAGVDRLALVVATHASRDHHGGLVEVMERFPVEALLDGGDGSADPAFRALLREAKSRGVRRFPATAPLTLRLAGSDLRIEVLSPPPRPPGPAPEDPNPRAAVALVTAGAFDLFLSADAESDALAPLDLPDVDAMKVPHHGSSDPGLPGLLDRLDPELAAIEVGPNTYGHPAPSTLNALERAGVETYRTDRHGTVTLTIDQGEMRIDTEH
jgi:competence protein ComEC